MRGTAIALVLAMTGCSAFATSRPAPTWRASRGGPPPDCTTSGVAVIDTLVAVAAVAVLVGAGRHHCGIDGHDESCQIVRNVTTGIAAPIATGYGISALVGYSRNHACEGARTTYLTANPGWKMPSEEP